MFPSDTDAAKTRALISRLLALVPQPDQLVEALCRTLAAPIAMVEVHADGEVRYEPFVHYWQAVARIETQCNRMITPADVTSTADGLIIGMGDGADFYAARTYSLTELPNEEVLEEALWCLRKAVIERAIEIVMCGVVTAEELEGLRAFSTLQPSADPPTSG